LKIVLIPEDTQNDQHVLKPIFERLLRNLSTSRSKVLIPQIRLGGSGEALKVERLAPIVEQYEYIADAFVLCVDRDGQGGRRQRLDEIEEEFSPNFFAVDAWEEIETWLLAGLQLPNTWRWSEIRPSLHTKEEYFEPLAKMRGLSETLGGGRKTLGAEAARKVDVIQQKCPEDFGNLATRLKSFAKGSD
jgi:hypothetical protein